MKKKDLIKAKSSELSDTDFIETDFRYFQGKLEFGSPDILNELEGGDKSTINGEGAAGVEKYLTTLFPTQSKKLSPEGEDTFEYYSSLTGIDGDETFCLLIPEKIDKVIAYDSHGKEALKIEFRDNEMLDSKVLWIVTTYKEPTYVYDEDGNPVYKKDGEGNIIVDDEGNPVREQTARGINLSYEAYKGDRNPVKKMSDYVLRNNDLTENWEGYIEKDGFLYSRISGSLIGTSEKSDRPIYDLKCAMADDGWNRAKRYSIGDTAKVGNTVFKSIEANNIGNHPYYSRMWVKS